MKWNLNTTIVTLFSASLLCLSSHSFVSAATSSPDDLASIFQTFREPKKIGFAGAIGGSSHFNWVLSIMDELADRGHNVTFFTKDNFLRFGKPYTNINTVSLGPGYVYDRAGIIDDPANRGNMIKLFPAMVKLLADHMDQDFATIADFVELYDLDVILCDHFFEPCINAAKAANIPFVITSALETTRDSAAPYVNNDLIIGSNPTTETESIWTRMNNKFIIPVRLMKKLWPQIQAINKRKEELGIITSGDSNIDWKDSIKLVNSLFGLMPARPLGPLVEAVGPIMPKKYQPLNNELSTYLDSHKRIAYVAFGQNAAPSKDSINVILTAIMESIESGDLDGFLWATVHAGDRFPDYITTSSNTSYSVTDMFENKNPHARMVKWAPQTAILLHPSIYLFVSHGGLGSWVESLYAGVRIIMFPFFGDQPANAILNERAKAGGILEQYHTSEEAAAIFKRILKDEDGEIEKGIKRFQALVQIHSSHGIIRGADVIEEVAFVNVNGKLPHRYPASRNMNFFKAHNLDIYGLLAVIILGSFFSLYYTSKIFIKSFTSKSSLHQKKMKSL